MTFEIDVHGRTRTVTVERVASSDTRFSLVIDGRRRLVDALRVDPATFSLILDEGRASHEVGVLEVGAPGELIIQSREGALRAVVNGRRVKRRAAVASVSSAGQQRVVAPMPGKVVRVLVAAGDAVAAGQGLVVVEAMKMENELRSPRAGRVKEVAVREGMSVEAGRLLVVVE